MTEPIQNNENAESMAALIGDPAAGLAHMQDLLKAKDDTSRFVGLALLKSVLDNQPGLREDVGQVTALWESISPKFLDRLLRAGKNQKVNKAEADDMVDIAVAVLHTFTTLLPSAACEDKRVVGRIPYLVNALLNSSAETTVSILQTLLTLVNLQNAAIEFLRIEDLSSLTEIAPQYPLALDIIGIAWSNASTKISEVELVRSNIDKIIPVLLATFKNTDAVTFLAFIADSLTKIPAEVVPQQPSWLPLTISLLRKLVINRPIQAGRSAYTNAASALLQAYPLECPALLFRDPTAMGNDSKPFSYLFVNLLLIDIRSSFPSLLSKLNSSEYPIISKRLAAAFDVISSFIGFLVRSLDDDVLKDNSSGLSMPPDLLLRLRKDIAETISLTIEYLRDRWDASVAGAAGLHPSARTGSAATSEGTRLTLTWDSMKDEISADQLVLAAIRVLAIWLREDENENLRNESAGLMDMIVELYKASSTAALDFRYPVLTALEGIMSTDDGVDNFLSQNGWEILSEDLLSLIRSVSVNGTRSVLTEAARGIEIVRVLLVVIDHESTAEPREDWMLLLKSVASMNTAGASAHPILMELDIAMLQLAAALLTKAPESMQRRYKQNVSGIFGLVSQLRHELVQFDGFSRQEFEESLDDILLDLENIH